MSIWFQHFFPFNETAYLAWLRLVWYLKICLYLRKWHLRPQTRPEWWVLYQYEITFYLCRYVKLSDCVFLNGSFPASFCWFPFFSNNLKNNNHRLQRDLNLDHQSRRRARWPRDHHHHHGPYRCLFNVKSILLKGSNSILHQQAPKCIATLKSEIVHNKLTHYQLST